MHRECCTPALRTMFLTTWIPPRSPNVHLSSAPCTFPSSLYSPSRKSISTLNGVGSNTILSVFCLGFFSCSHVHIYHQIVGIIYAQSHCAYLQSSLLVLHYFLEIWLAWHRTQGKTCSKRWTGAWANCSGGQPKSRNGKGGRSMFCLWWSHFVLHLAVVNPHREGLAWLVMPAYSPKRQVHKAVASGTPFCQGAFLACKVAINDKSS